MTKHTDASPQPSQLVNFRPESRTRGPSASTSCVLMSSKERPPLAVAGCESTGAADCLTLRSKDFSDTRHPTLGS